MKDSTQNDVRVEYASDYIYSLLSVAKTLFESNKDILCSANQSMSGVLTERVLFCCSILASELRNFHHGLENCEIVTKEEDRDRFENLLEYVADITVRPVHSVITINSRCYRRAWDVMEMYMLVFYQLYDEDYDFRYDIFDSYCVSKSERTGL